MNAPHNPAQAYAWRKRTAAAFAAVGALIFSSGIVMLSAPAANAAAPVKVGVCHRTGGDHHPYTFQKVAANSTALQAHRDHQTDDDAGQDKHWKSDGVWHGVTHDAGAFKPDYIQGDVGVPTDLDEFRSWCLQDLDSGGGDEDPTKLPLATPDFEANRACAVEGWVSEPASSGISYTIDGGEDWDNFTSGNHTVTATLDDAESRFETPLPAGWSPGQGAGTATYVVSLGEATSPCLQGTIGELGVNPVGKCDTYGSITLPTPAINVTYSIAGGSWTGLSGAYDVVATLAGGATSFSSIPAGWSQTSPTAATRTVNVGTFTACGSGGGGVVPDPVVPDPELKRVTPLYPSATPADCANRGHLVVPAQPEGVVTTRSGAVPGDVTFTFAPAAGYAFPAGTDTEVTVTVDKKLSGEDCVLGEETTSPKPHTTKPKPRDRAPIVLGSQAAVPTAVDAGLAGLPSTSVSPISSPRLAQALVAGGLLLLIAGGSMGLGRRTRGAHES